MLHQWLRKAVDNLIEEAKEEIIVMHPNDELQPSLVLSILKRAKKANLKVTFVYDSQVPHQADFETHNPVYSLFPDLEIRVGNVMNSCYFCNETKALVFNPATQKSFTEANGGWLVNRSDVQDDSQACSCNDHIHQVLSYSRLVVRKYPLLNRV